MNYTLFLADFGNEFGPVIACLGCFMIPIIAILTSHQRKMAMIIHGSQAQQNQQNMQNDALASEVRELKQIVYQQSISIDSISSKLDRMSTPAPGTNVQQRLTGTEG